MTDPLLGLLDGLPPARLDSARVDRVRARCHEALARRRPRRVGGPAGATRLWTPIVAGLGGAYLTAVLRQVLILYGLR